MNYSNVLLIVVAVLTLILLPQYHAADTTRCYSLALNIGIDDRDSEGWIELVNENPFTIIIHRLVNLSKDEKEAQIRLVFQKGQCTIDGLGFKSNPGYTSIPFRENNLTQYESKNRYVQFPDSLESFKGYFLVKIPQGTIVDSLEYDGKNYKMSFNCSYERQQDRYNCECQCSWPSPSEGRAPIPLWFRGWDLDGDGQLEHCIGLNEYRFMGIKVFSKTPAHFASLAKVTEMLISTDFRNDEAAMRIVFSKSFHKVVLLNANDAP